MSRAYLTAAGLILLGALLFRWYRKHSRPERAPLSLKERAQMLNIRLGYEATEAPDADYEDRGLL